MNRIDLSGRCAVVTGGASGIGLAVCERLAASGARVAIWDLSADAAARAAASLPAVPTRAHLAVVVDVSDEHSVGQAMSDTVAAFGRLDIQVCSAGVAGPNALTWEFPVAAWRSVMAINVDGVFLCNRAAVPAMLANDYGRIVNIASVAGKEGNPTASAYSASKAAVIGLTKSLGKETAKSGIRVNCITPAAVRTAIFDQITQQHIDFMLSKIPIGRFGLVEEIAAMVAWLVSEECSFSTGAVFDLSGGRATY
ncbi:MAG: SDR family oxidoreductase [Burkholderiaceae bacterium]|nr:SDR family oxidoreductase [Burkholderiaceae bacterium]